MDEINEHQLIAKGKLGDRSAVSELFERHYRTSLSVARRLLRSEAESQDAVQSAYFSAFKNLDNFRGDATFNTWITRIVVNRCLMTMREPWRARVVDSPAHLESPVGLDQFANRAPTPDRLAWCRQVEAAPTEAVSKLPDVLRAAYSLYFLSDMSLEEVANSLGISRAATKSRVFRSRRLMQSWLGSYN
jgi:RNA polymerase sigma-70 factor (ECF subfamily)